MSALSLVLNITVIIVLVSFLLYSCTLFLVPFLEQPPALTGTLPGDVGFDPIGFTSFWSDKDWSQQVVPDTWLDPAKRTPISTVEWMRESELKHGRLAMLAVLGWVAVDLGFRFPGETFSAIPNSFSAHTAAVQNGSMG
jgi:light-harvesting complex I chlorophyll a/b binding protein 1